MVLAFFGVCVVAGAIVIVTVIRISIRERGVKAMADDAAATVRALATGLEPVVPLFTDLARQNPSIAESVDVGRLEIVKAIADARKCADHLERWKGKGPV